ncbi:hypothetical protein C8R47DRAFT_1147112 [Mycena vitilis]|nr:hypothetical protein C8R47DRAFT_1170452 [Mycena vitilis]KAJ6464209.1 hypothetical protein C8R47DRAFT_1156763 [Mycena vitilis]KAJ6471799.1 hypothetical protein C8R47DRAFT_1147112 [Mycena vitilis]
MYSSSVSPSASSLLLGVLASALARVSASSDRRVLRGGASSILTSLLTRFGFGASRSGLASNMRRGSPGVPGRDAAGCVRFEAAGSSRTSCPVSPSISPGSMSGDFTGFGAVPGG